MSTPNSQDSTNKRPPVVAIMGHVDHGKSTLLDTIRHTNVVAGEAGGITQHVSAYEVIHPTPDGDRKITFIDTPGHAAFQSIRNTSATLADIAVLIVAADDGVKTQTIEAWKTIQANNVPYLVAINKIDKPGSDIDRVIRELMELGVYLEGYGGDISYVKISAKQGTGIDDLLETILLLSEFIDLSYNPDVPATGFVIESHVDSQRGIAATLLIKNGTLNKSQFVVSGRSIATCRSINDYRGKPIDSATVSAPIQIYGFSEQCPVGSIFETFNSKDEADCVAANCTENYRWIDEVPVSNEMTVVSVVVKCDVVGSIDAVVSEIRSHTSDRMFFKIVHAGVGDVSESDIQKIIRDDEPLVIAFNVNVDRQVADMDLPKSIHIKKFDVIYRIGEWLQEVAENRKFRKKIESVVGSAQVLKIFSQEKNTYLIGIRVASGMFNVRDTVRIVRNREIAMRGKIVSIQVGKSSSQKVEEGNDAGMMVELPALPRQFDLIEAITMIEG